MTEKAAATTIGLLIRLADPQTWSDTSKVWVVQMTPDPYVRDGRLYFKVHVNDVTFEVSADELEPLL